MKTPEIIVATLFLIALVLSFVYLENLFLKRIWDKVKDVWFNIWLFCAVCVVWFIDLFNKDKTMW